MLHTQKPWHLRRLSDPNPMKDVPVQDSGKNQERTNFNFILLTRAILGCMNATSLLWAQKYIKMARTSETNPMGTSPGLEANLKAYAIYDKHSAYEVQAYTFKVFRFQEMLCPHRCRRSAIVVTSVRSVFDKSVSPISIQS